MQKRVYFLRSASYDYKIDGKNLYQSFDLVARRIIDPPLDMTHGPHVPKQLHQLNVTAFCSPSKRSAQTATLVTTKVSVLSDLLEVKYKMANFISEKDFYDQQGRPQVRKAREAFVQALIQNQLEESYQLVIQRIESMLKTISKENSSNIIVFSHGFLLKIIEAYAKDKSIKTHPPHLIKYFDGSVETFKFCEGFLLRVKNRKFIFDSYIRNEGK